jgi:hypothetical protein
MNTNLTETQKSILIAAAERPDHRLEWFPEGVKGGARAKVLASLQSKGLVEIQDDHPIISNAGLAVLGLPEVPTEPAEETHPASTESPGTEAPKARKTRENTKQATVIAMLHRPEGATLEQLVEATRWQKHTVRGALSLLSKKQGLTIVSAKHESGRVYHIATEGGA